jgi:hypothetical protein
MSLNVSFPSKQSPSPSHTLRGDLVGVGLIVIEAWLTVASGTPVLDACRELIRLGYPPDTILQVFRNGQPSLTVHNIGEVAQLEINGKRDGFIKRRSAVGTAPPMRSPKLAATHRETR